MSRLVCAMNCVAGQTLGCFVFLVFLFRLGSILLSLVLSDKQERCHFNVEGSCMTSCMI